LSRLFQKTKEFLRHWLGLNVSASGKLWSLWWA